MGGCKIENCKKRAYYNFENNMNPVYCSEHKEEGMIIIYQNSQKCEKCNKHPFYNFINETIYRFCGDHKLDGMIDIKSKICESDECKLRASFNYVGLSPKFCSKHKIDGMINIKNRLCEYTECKITSSYNYDGLHRKFCANHKKDGMINVVNKKCHADGCEKLPSFNYFGEIYKYCVTHKLPDMIDVKNVKCHYKGCTKQPSYNHIGQNGGKYCTEHKLDDMVDIVNGIIRGALCKTYLCNTIVGKKYEGYCFRCFMYTFPDKPITRNYKTKEFSVVDYITKEFPEYAWITDKSIQGGCSKKRPDLLLDLGYHVVIVEIDENQHKSYECSCDNKRIMELSQDVGHRPIVFIRFNPDDYVDQEGKNVKSCWSITKQTGIIKIGNPTDWKTRMENLSNQIKYWTNPENTSEKTVEIVELYYDQNL